jgi:hypothetical protein
MKEHLPYCSQTLLETITKLEADNERYKCQITMLEDNITITRLDDLKHQIKELTRRIDGKIP